MGAVISREEVLRRVRRLERLRPEPLLIAIDGCGGAGKSFLAEWLASQLPAQVIHIDDFGRPGRPYEVWDWERFREQVLEPLSQDRAAHYQRYDWDSDRLTDWVDVEPGGVVIAEGVSSTRTELGDPWHLKVWVECPRDVRFERGTTRDGEAMREMWLNFWMPEEDAYVQDQRPQERADVVIYGTMIGGPAAPEV